MSLLLNITDGSTTIDLATSSGAGIRLVRFRPPMTNRTATRVGPGPGVIGQRTTISTLGDADCELQIRIEQPPLAAPRFSALPAVDTPGVMAQYIALVKMLERARDWEERRIGVPVRLVYRRDGAANTRYWTITGATLGESSGPDLWLLIETANSQLTLTFHLTVEPVSHAATLGYAAHSIGFLTVYGSDLVTCNAIGGSVDAPINITATKLSANGTNTDWTTMWLAEVIGTPDVTDYSGTADATAWTLGGGAGACQVQTGATMSFTGSGYVINTSQQYPIRGFIRMKITSAPTAGVGAVQVRMRINYGTSTGTQKTMSWVSFPGPLNVWFLVDLGAVPVLTNLQNRENQASANYFVTIEMQSTDATSFTARADYSTFFAFYGFTKLSGISVGQGEFLTYEDTYTVLSPTYVAPRQSPQVYETTAAGALQANASRYGRLARISVNTITGIWVAAQNDTAGHTITDTGELTVEYLACHALGEAA